MTWLAVFLAEIVKWLGSLLVERASRPSTAEDGASPGSLERRLREKVRAEGW